MRSWPRISSACPTRCNGLRRRCRRRAPRSEPNSRPLSRSTPSSCSTCSRSRRTSTPERGRWRRRSRKCVWRRRQRVVRPLPRAGPSRNRCWPRSRGRGPPRRLHRPVVRSARATSASRICFEERLRRFVGVRPTTPIGSWVHPTCSMWGAAAANFWICCASGASRPWAWTRTRKWSRNAACAVYARSTRTRWPTWQACRTTVWAG